MPHNIQYHGQDSKKLAWDSLARLTDYVEEENYRGYDPYDALNSRLLRFLSFNLKYTRILFIQLLKNLPVNVRPLLGISKEINPKALGLFLWGYAKLYAVNQNEEHLDTINRILDFLEQAKSKGYSGNCWGYNFDWQSRAFYAPRYTPTIVNSSFIGHALIDTYKITGMEKALYMAMPIKDFILNDLNRTVDGEDFCFSYAPIDQTTVHNASLLGASLLIRLYRYNTDEQVKNTALYALHYSMKRQKNDGSWFYADTDIQNWIDSFHTGFNLQSIQYFFQEGFAGEYKSNFSKGVEFYKQKFFLEDGTPKYYHDRIFPIDIHAPAQALVFFSMLGGEHRSFSESILKWMINNMQDDKGYFYFRKFKKFTNRIPYMRWGQAWAFHALTEFLFRGHFPNPLISDSASALCD